MKNKFKILGSGVDLSGINYPVNLYDYQFDFWATSIREGNDHLYFLPPSGNLVVIVDFLDNLLPALEGHLRQIGRTQIDLLLVPPREDYSSLLKILDLDFISGVGIYNPKTLDEFVVSYNALREIILPQYVGLNLSPIEFRYDIIKKINELDLEIIGFNPLGGHLDFPRCIEIFTLPYLLGFSATYSSLVFLSSTDLISSQMNSTYLDNLIGKESGELYKLEKTNIDITGVPQKIINTSVKVGENQLAYRNPQMIFPPEDMIIKISKTQETTISPGMLGEPFYDNFVNYIESVCNYPEDGDDVDFVDILRYRTIDSLRSSLRPEELDIIKIDLKTFIFRTSKNYYLLTIKDGLPLFSEIQEIPL